MIVCVLLAVTPGAAAITTNTRTVKRDDVRLDCNVPGNFWGGGADVEAPGGLGRAEGQHLVEGKAG